MEYQSHTQRLSLFKDCSFDIQVKFLEDKVRVLSEVLKLACPAILGVCANLADGHSSERLSVSELFQRRGLPNAGVPLCAPLRVRCWPSLGRAPALAAASSSQGRASGSGCHSPLCSTPLLWVGRAQLRTHLPCLRSLECVERTHSGCSQGRLLSPASASWMPACLFLSSGSVRLRQRTCILLLSLAPKSPSQSPELSLPSPAEVWS